MQAGTKPVLTKRGQHAKNKIMNQDEAEIVMVSASIFYFP